MGTMIRKETYSPFQVYMHLVRVGINSKRDAFVLAGAILKIMSILNIRSKVWRRSLTFYL